MKTPSRQSVFRYTYRVFELCASLELAVCLILSLAVVLAVGTVYESKYGAAVASREVYRSLWMQGLLWFFMCNLAAVALSRLPWKRQHIGFLVTHLGLITLLLGSWLTQRQGVDGTVAFGPGETARAARIDESMLYMFRAVSGKTYDLILNQGLDFDSRRPLQKPLVFALPTGQGPSELRVLQYLPKALREVRAEDVPVGQGVPAVKFRMAGSRATFADWLFLQADTGATREVGPAVFRFTAQRPNLQMKPEKATVVLYGDGSPQLPPKLAVARAGQAFREFGRITPGKEIPLGWMDFGLTVEEYHPSAIPRGEYHPAASKAAEGEGLEVIEVELDRQKLWLEMGAAGQIASGDALYYVQYTKKQVELGFEVKLKQFRIGYYQGTTRPESYSSEVEVAGVSHLISMNEPLTSNGYTLYQSSYEADSDGTPRYSVLSVNYDPGRRIKYLGSLMIVLGIISMFYFKPVYSGKSKWLQKKEARQ